MGCYKRKNKRIPKNITKEGKTTNHPYNKIKNNKYKDDMNQLLIDACKNVIELFDKNKSIKALILDGKGCRTTNALLNNNICKKKNIESVEFDKDTYNLHLKEGIKSNFMSLDTYLKSYNNDPFDIFCCDSLGTIQTSGKFIFEAIKNNYITSGSLFLVTFSKRGTLYGENFEEELFKFYRKLEKLLETYGLYLMNIPNLDQTFIEYAGKNQSAMYSEIFLIGTTKSQKRLINYPNDEYFPERIIKHTGSMYKKNKLKFFIKWQNYEQIYTETWFNLKNCEVFHEYLRKNKMNKLIPDLYK